MTINHILEAFSTSALEVASTASGAAKTLQAASSYLDSVFTYTSSNAAPWNQYVTNATNTCREISRFSTELAGYTTFSSVYTTKTFSEGITSLSRNGLEEAANILAGRSGWNWETRITGLQTHLEENNVSSLHMKSLSTVMSRNMYLRRQKPELYQYVQEVLSA